MPDFRNPLITPLAQKYLGGQACSLLAFGAKGGAEHGKRFYNALRLVQTAG